MNTTDVIYYMLASFKFGVSTPRVWLQMCRSSEKLYGYVFEMCTFGFINGHVKQNARKK